jgi:transposase
MKLHGNNRLKWLQGDPMPIRELRTVSLRIKAGEMLLNGRDVTQVAQELGLCETSVRKYRAIVEHEGIAALQTLPLGGRREARYGVKYSHSHMWKIIAERGLTSLVSRGRNSPPGR